MPRYASVSEALQQLAAAVTREASAVGAELGVQMVSGAVDSKELQSRLEELRAAPVVEEPRREELARRREAAMDVGRDGARVALDPVRSRQARLARPPVAGGIRALLPPAARYS